MGEADVSIEVTRYVDAGLRRELVEFFGALEGERRTFVTSLDGVLRSEVMVTARSKGRLVGLMGVTRRFFRLPFRYAVVVEGMQGNGIARKMYAAELPSLGRYPFVFAIVMNENRRGLSWSESRGDIVLHRDERYTYVCNGSSPLYRRLCVVLLKPVLPAALALRRRLLSLSGRR
jgi:hypothetical protein